MSEQTLTVQGKILKIAAYILLGTGMVFFMFAVSSVFMGITPPFLDVFTLFLFGFSLVLGGALLLVVAQQGIIKTEFDTISLIKCTNAPDCKYRKARKFEKDEFPVSEKICDRHICLPIYNNMKDEEINYILDSIKEVL